MRERAFYMAGVSRHEILQEMQHIVDRSATGDAGEFELRKQWESALDREGYVPEPGQEGTIKDLRSLRRFNVALRTNRALMNGWAQKENGLRPGPLKAQPAYELVRFQEAKIPRDWLDRFVAAGGTLYQGRMIAPKLSTVWIQLGSIELFDDALGVDYPPFAWGSGMNWKLVGARETIDLGVMTAEEIRTQAGLSMPVVSSPNASLQSVPVITAPDLRESLATELRGLAEWQDAKLIFTDPNGTRPTDEAGLRRIWSQALPDAFHDVAPEGLFQRQAVLDFSDDPERFARKTERNAWDDLTRAVGRRADALQRLRIMRAIANRDDLSWIDALLTSAEWKVAMGLTDLAARAARIVTAIKLLF